MNLNNLINDSVPKKRGRPKGKLRNTQDDGSTSNTSIKKMHESGNFNDEIIVHLQITTADIKNISLEETEVNNYKSNYGDATNKSESIMDITEVDETDTQTPKTGVCSTAGQFKLYRASVPMWETSECYEEDITTEYTEIACLWDTCKIKGKPYFLPDKYFNNKYYVIGWFCSINCAIAYNINLGDNRMGDRLSLLKVLYGVKHENVMPSPTCRILHKFGGNMSITEYRGRLNNAIHGHTQSAVAFAPTGRISKDLNKMAEH